MNWFSFLRRWIEQCCVSWMLGTWLKATSKSDEMIKIYWKNGRWENSDYYNRINVKCHVSHHIKSHFIVKGILKWCIKLWYVNGLLTFGKISTRNITCALFLLWQKILSTLMYIDIRFCLQSIFNVFDNKIKMGKFIKNACLNKYMFLPSTSFNLNKQQAIEKTRNMSLFLRVYVFAQNFEFKYLYQIGSWVAINDTPKISTQWILQIPRWHKMR